MRDKNSLQIRLQQLKAERKRLKSEVAMKKLACNSAFGKLGSPYCSFYAPDLLLAVTLTGQLNLLSLIHELEFDPAVTIISANTDGIMVKYPIELRDRVLSVILGNAKRTGYDYEETPYEKVALTNVNNYFAVTSGRDAALISATEGISHHKGKRGKVKRKGLYAESGLMKNPTFEVCSDAVAAHLKDGSDIATHIRACTDIRKFVSIRNITGGGLQYDSMVEADDWYEVEPGQWSHPGRKTANVKRKSRPAPYMRGVGGTKCGRVARWYMSTNSPSPIFYVKSGNKVPQTEGARLCMNLPKEVPRDIDYDWYINYANEILSSIGAQDGKEIQR